MMRRPTNYILDGHRPVPEPNMVRWAMWFETGNRIVRQQRLYRGDPPQEYAYVSTVFLGLDHNFSRIGPPVLFETMVFADGTDIDGIQERCSTWDDAERQHVRVCQEVEKRFEHAPVAKSWRRPNDERNQNN